MSTGAAIIPFPRREADGQAWEPWITEPALAHHFGVSTRTVRRWRDDGMPSRLIGGSRRYRISEAETWHLQRGAA